MDVREIPRGKCFGRVGHPKDLFLKVGHPYLWDGKSSHQALDLKNESEPVFPLGFKTVEMQIVPSPWETTPVEPAMNKWELPIQSGPDQQIVAQVQQIYPQTKSEVVMKANKPYLVFTGTLALKTEIEEYLRTANAA